jgi:hypothetical protein
MSINLDAIKSRLNSLKNTNNRTSNLWKPEPGEHQIRIVPYIHNRENPFLEMYFHYNLGKRSILSPVSFGRPDPIVDFAEKLKQTGDKSDWIMGRKLEPKMRIYVPVIIRGQENEGVKFWGFGKQLYQELLGFFADPDYGDLSDLKTGRDIVVTVKSPEETGRDYAETTIRIKPKETVVTEDQSVIEKIKEQSKITELYPEPTYDELKIQLQTWLGKSDEPAEDLNYKQEKKETKSETSSTSTDDIGVTFDDLF